MTKPTQKRKKREREARRETILKAAAKVLSRKGFYESTLDEIAAEAELAKGTLYNYYKDKQDIFLSLVERGFDSANQAINEAVEQGGTLPEMISRITRVTLRVIDENHYLARIAHSSGGSMSSEEHEWVHSRWQKATDEGMETLARVLGTYPETRHLSKADLYRWATIIFGLISLATSRRFMRAEENVIEDEIEQFTRLICRGITAEQGE